MLTGPPSSPAADEWRPRGVADLEPNAWRALRAPASTCVVAGPGAGKTEFLAQRAAYLLETGLCPPPRRILAISFKTDAAANLAARVSERCGPDSARRLVSLTFDAFTKGLVDRFRDALPKHWRPTKPYELVFPTRRGLEDFLTRARLAAPADWQAAIAGLQVEAFEQSVLGAFRLPPTPISPSSVKAYLVGRWWEETLRADGHSRLSFIALNRLAELLLRSCPQLLRAQRATHPFVFVDEFQDTTHAQYDLLASVFGGGSTVVTAVGDDKQRIMLWAGARRDAFSRFAEDFAAERIPLLTNFRSSPDLVRIQHHVARALEPGTAPTVARAPRRVNGNVAQVWRSTSEKDEASHLASWLAADMVARGLRPRDYAVLVRQQADRFEGRLAPAFAAAGLALRNESRPVGRTNLQDLLVGAYCRLALPLLRLGTVRRAPEAWTAANSGLQRVLGVDPGDEAACHGIDRRLRDFLRELRETMAATPPGSELAAELASRVLELATPDGLRRAHGEYGTGDALGIATEAFALHFAASSEQAASWADALDRFEGVGQVPLMTVHKSKGLEYDTVLFVGLDDAMWWSHTPGNPEGLATFFVGLSRAKQRAIFTFCEARGERRRVAQFYELLADAGVPELLVAPAASAD